MGYKKEFKNITNAVKSILKKSPRCHDWEHTMRVLHNARELAAVEKKCDMMVVEFGAVLHDIARADEMAIKGKVCHAEKGSKMADKILKDEGIEKGTRTKIVKCVRRHRFRSSQAPKSIEEKIIYDADKLDSVGAVGLGRAFLFAGHCGAKVHNKKDEAVNSSTYSENDTAYREFLVKQRFIPDKMLTDIGRKVAKERVKFMKEFFEKLDDEIYG